MTRDEAESKGREALRLLTEIHDNRHELGRLCWSEKNAFIVQRFATHDAIEKARRVVAMLTDAPAASLTVAGANAGPDRLGG